MRTRFRGLLRRWRLPQRHPWDRGYVDEWEQRLIDYWTRNCSHRRHREPFSKTLRGKNRREARRFKHRGEPL